MKSWKIHYLNKYPGGSVESSESSFRVYDKDGDLRVALVKDGGGSWADISAEEGLPDRHDLAPIPKEARVHKLVKGVVGHDRDGKDVHGEVIGLDDKAEERKKSREEFADESGRIMSCAELKAKKGFDFDEKQRKI
jgi:hypothetical protein